MTKRTATRQLLGLLAWLAVSFTAAAIGAFASANAGGFYMELARPQWAPPAWLFGPAWTVLYALMGTAAWLVWKARGWRDAAPALSLFLVQLVLNALWTWIFFVWHLGAVAFIEIIVLLAMIVWMLVLFWRVRPVAGMLIIPYVLWVAFASALTYAMWQLNPQLLA